MKLIVRTLCAAATALLVVALASHSTLAASCIKAGGEGQGMLQDFATFMAEAAMKNQAKAWGGDNVKLAKANTTCKSNGVLYTCTAHAKACK
jgi:hypothetical protein